MSRALVIGGGPAGLMAADQLSQAGLRVVLAEAKPSIGRKFLMAGKSGLNLTKDEETLQHLLQFEPLPAPLEAALRAFGPAEVVAWAESLGQPCFTGSSGRVFPVAMKASPLLRAWGAKLDRQGVEIRRRWTWLGFGDGAARFSTPQGERTLAADVTILAMGGASWARLGSDGLWAGAFPAEALAPFQPANMGFRVDWSAHMAPHFGKPVKAAALRVGAQVLRAEFVIARPGLEGGGIYAVSRRLREGARLQLDLVPDRDPGAVEALLAQPRGKATLASALRKRLKLDPVRLALVQEFGRPLPADPGALARLIKALPVPLAGPYPIDQAISTAGGLAFSGLDQGLMLRDRPGVFAAGEMLDWEAPTGGYLLTACLSTGRWAGLHAAAYARAAL